MLQVQVETVRRCQQQLTLCDKFIHWWVVSAYDKGSCCARFVEIVSKSLSLTGTDVDGLL